MKVRRVALMFAICLASMPLAAVAASFDCAKASTPIEKAICSDSELSNYDEVLSAGYKQSVAQSADPHQAKIEQRQWLKGKRDACGTDVSCLKDAYKERIAALQSGASLAKSQSTPALPAAPASTSPPPQSAAVQSPPKFPIQDLPPACEQFVQVDYQCGKALIRLTELTSPDDAEQERKKLSLSQIRSEYQQVQQEVGNAVLAHRCASDYRSAELKNAQNIYTVVQLGGAMTEDCTDAFQNLR